MGEINEVGDYQSFDQVLLETVVVATKLEKELVPIKVAAAADDDKKYQTKSSGSSNRVKEVVKDIPDIFVWFMANFKSYILSIPPEGKAPYHHQSGFYNIPEDMLSPNISTREEEIKLLYQPATGANFRNISNLLKDIFEGRSTERQSSELRHYCYHLNSYNYYVKTDIAKLMVEVCSERKEIAKSWYRPDDDDEKASSSNNINGRDFLRDSLALLLASCFLFDMLRKYHLNKLSVMDDPECAHLWVSDLWADLLLLQNQIPFKFVGYGLDYWFIYHYFCNFLSMNEVTFTEIRIIPISTGTTDHDDGRSSSNTNAIHPLHLLHLVHHMLLPRKREHQVVRSLFVGSITRTLADIRRWLIEHQAIQSLFVRPITRTLADIRRWIEHQAIQYLYHNRITRAVYVACSRCWLMFHTSDGNISPTSWIKPVPTVTRLQQAGVKFRPLYKAGFAVEFKSGVLKLPFLHITKCTKKVLLNLIAWEKTHRDAPKYFINYAIVMDHLINTSKDVEILIESRVFQHSLPTDEEVAALFNGLGQNLVYAKDERYDIFPKLSFDLNEYCQRRSNMWWANLKQDYFKSPWTIISLIAAMFLILLTVAQTFFSAYSYFRPPQ